MVLARNPGKVMTMVVAVVVTMAHQVAAQDFRVTFPRECDMADQGYYMGPVAEACDQYYHCSPTQARQMTCAAGTLFDVAGRMCLAEDQVDCGTRPKPGDPRRGPTGPRRPSLRRNPDPPVQYQLSMPVPFTNANFNVTSCENARQALNDALLEEIVCTDFINGCSFTDLFDCQPIGLPGPAQPAGVFFNYRVR